MTQPTAPSPQPQHSGERTQWDASRDPAGANSGWYVPGEDWFIRPIDSYWQNLLDKTRTAYGDPNIRYNTDDISQPRYLQFGDGTPLPKDGTVIYHNTDAKQNFVRNTDGSLTRQDFNGNPLGAGAFSPAGYRKVGDQYAPVDASGAQVAPLMPAAALPPMMADHGNGIYTPASSNGDYYTVDPATGQINYFDQAGKPISEQTYLANAPHAEPGVAQAPAAGGRGANSGPTPPVSSTPMQSPAVGIPSGMTRPEYPGWATDVDPDIPNQMTAVVARLYELFGTGAPAQSALPEFPFNTSDGRDSGIDAYAAVKTKFIDIEQRFEDAAQAYRTAVTNSAFTTTAGRQAINDAIANFNSTTAAIPEKDWGGLLAAESRMLDQIKSEVLKASGQVPSIPPNPDPAPQTPPAGPAEPPAVGGPGGADPQDPSVPGPAATVPGPPASGPEGQQPTGDDLRGALQEILGNQPPAAPMANPLGALGNPLGALGGMNPLGGLGGMNPLGALGGLGGLGGLGAAPATPLSPIPEAKPAAVKPVEPIKPLEEAKPVSPLTPAGITAPPDGPLAAEAAAPPPGITPAGAGPVAEGSGEVGGRAEPAAASSNKPSVTLPDGKVVEASDPQAAQAAQAALDKAGPGGDAAQKAYNQAGLELPSDGKNPGAKVDPADMQPGDVLKWHDKTMVAVAPGLVADPTQPGVTRTLQEVLNNPQGFQGMFRPTDTDPTLSAHNSPPPVLNNPPDSATPAPPENRPPAAPPPPPPTPATPPAPSPAPGQTIPLSAAPADPAGQAAPPSPFETPKPPPATRSTKADRIAAGQD